MNQYALYVWPCYILTFSLLIWQLIFAVLEWRKTLKILFQRRTTVVSELHCK